MPGGQRKHGVAPFCLTPREQNNAFSLYHLDTRHPCSSSVPGRNGFSRCTAAEGAEGAKGATQDLGRDEKGTTRGGTRFDFLLPSLAAAGGEAGTGGHHA